MKKLNLKKEVLVRLDAADLQAVNGGLTRRSDCNDEPVESLLWCIAEKGESGKTLRTEFPTNYE